MNDYYIEVIFDSILVKDEGYVESCVTITSIDYESDERLVVGSALIYLFNEYMVSDWDQLIYNADSISADVLEVIRVLEKAKNNEEIYGLIAIIEDIEISEEYRGHGYCNYAIDEINDYLEYIGVSYIGLIPARIYRDRVEQNNKKAIEFYTNKGFKPLAAKLGEKFVMGKSLL